MGIPGVLFGSARGADCASAVRAVPKVRTGPTSWCWSLSPPAPNQALEPTAYSVRSCVAPASSGGSPLAFGS